MAARSARRGFVPLTPDVTNSNPYRGLPPDYPSAHSRFPIVPPQQIGDLSFVPPLSENGAEEGTRAEMTEAARVAWREVMDRAVGDLLPDGTPAPARKPD